MRRSAAALCVTLLGAGLVFAGCGKDEDSNAGTGGTSGAGGRAGSAGSAGALGDGGLKPCLDRPTELERAPSGRLPCDLLPPGLSL